MVQIKISRGCLQTIFKPLKTSKKSRRLYHSEFNNKKPENIMCSACEYTYFIMLIYY